MSSRLAAPEAFALRLKKKLNVTDLLKIVESFRFLFKIRKKVTLDGGFIRHLRYSPVSNIIPPAPILD